MAPYPKRLIKVNLPIKRISAQARREKSIRHGHISTLHIWWGRRPLAACRAVICAALWPEQAGAWRAEGRGGRPAHPDHVRQGTRCCCLATAGRSEALKQFLVGDGISQNAAFWRLVQTLSALYPAGSEEK